MPVQVRETTTTFLVIGSDIQKSITSRISRNKGEIDKCLTNVSSMLKEKAQHNIEQIAEQATAIMLVLAMGEHLTSDSLVVKTQVERASFLSKENLELSCIAKNLDKDTIYKVTSQEAMRYGLV